jgi:hypothetical protein
MSDHIECRRPNPCTHPRGRLYWDGGCSSCAFHSCRSQTASSPSIPAKRRASMAQPRRMLWEICSWIRLGTAHVLRAIKLQVQIQMIVPHRIATESCDVLRQGTINDGSGGGSGCNIAGDPRETPCRRSVPEVLHGRIVVEVQAVDQFLAAHLRLIRVADIRVIHAEMVGLGVVSHLKKAADVACPCPSKKERYILRKFKIAILGRRYR